MPRSSLALLGLVLSIFVLSCGDGSPDRLLVPEDPALTVGSDAAAIAQIQTRINALFPQPERRDANGTFAQVKQAVAVGDDAQATESALALIQLALDTELLDPRGPETTADALTRMLDELYAFVGLDVPSLDPAVFQDDDAAVEVVDPAEEETVVTENEEAGAQFPEGATDQPVLAVIQRIDLAEGEVCLPTNRIQREGCYQYSTYPVVEEFNVPVATGICFDDSGLTAEQAERFRLYKHSDGEDLVVALENVDVDFLSCDEPVASSGLGRAFQKLARVLLPRPAYAADTGLGGMVGSFSRIGWAGSTILAYDPSIDVSTNGLHTEETLAEELGHFVVAADDVTWQAMSAVGPGGFGDYDAIVIGEKSVLLTVPESNAATWSSVVTGHIVVNGLHSVKHTCGVNDCPPSSVQQRVAAGRSYKNAVEWVAGGSLLDSPWTGLYVGLGSREANGPITPPGTTLALLSEFGTFDVLGRHGSFFQFGDETDEVTIVDGAHPTMSGLTDADLSYWFLSLHVLISEYPSDFNVVATGLQKLTSADAGTTYAGVIARSAPGASQHH